MFFTSLMCLVFRHFHGLTFFLDFCQVFNFLHHSLSYDVYIHNVCHHSSSFGVVLYFSYYYDIGMFTRLMKCSVILLLFLMDFCLAYSCSLCCFDFAYYFNCFMVDLL